MKLDVAAALFQSTIPVRVTLIFSLLLSVPIAFVAGTAMALDGINLSEPAEEVAAGECPRLIQIKYPFISCSDGQIGMAEGDDSWENSRQIPLQRDWVEGTGWWGPDQNQM